MHNVGTQPALRPVLNSVHLCKLLVYQIDEAVCRINNTAARGDNVWRRLEADTASRKALPCRQYSYHEGSTAQCSDVLGWSKCTTWTDVKQAPDGTTLLDAPLNAMHKTQLEKFRLGHPVEYFAAIRPQCKTTTQTMRCALLVSQQSAVVSAMRMLAFHYSAAMSLRHWPFKAVH